MLKGKIHQITITTLEGITWSDIIKIFLYILNFENAALWRHNGIKQRHNDLID